MAEIDISLLKGRQVRKVDDAGRPSVQLYFPVLLLILSFFLQFNVVY